MFCLIQPMIRQAEWRGEQINQISHQLSSWNWNIQNSDQKFNTVMYITEYKVIPFLTT